MSRPALSLLRACLNPDRQHRKHPRSLTRSMVDIRSVSGALMHMCSIAMDDDDLS